MNDGIDGVRNAFQNAEDIDVDQHEDVQKVASDPLSASPTRRKPSRSGSEDGPSMLDDGGAEVVLPPGFPVQPLGMAGGKFHFLTARGELTELSAHAMSSRANLMALVTGAEDAIGHLAMLGPPGRRDNGFNPSNAADKLMMACSALPLFNGSISMRHFGTWRGGTSSPVVHLGERLEAAAEEDQNGRMIARALYPAVPSIAAPATDAATADDLDWIRRRLKLYWNWGGENDADILIGWIGQAALGQYPTWRTHCYLKGKHGAGKTTATKIVSWLLGGMSTGVKNSSSEAAVRQTTNRMAIARVFDEAEAEEGGRVGDVIELFRLMSDAEGAQVERGTSDHAGIRFGLYGAGFLASIIPAAMTSADRSRFVILTLGERAQERGPGAPDPTAQAVMLEELQEDARELGPKVWRRMLDLAPSRWDKTFRLYNALIQNMGARARSGDTIGAVLAGWDLMLFDTPLIDPVTGDHDNDRLQRAMDIARPLIEVSAVAEEEGEGERCLRNIFGAMLNKDHGGVISVSEHIETMMQSTSDPESFANKLIGRIGLRLMKGEEGQRALFVANGSTPQLDAALRGTRWQKGGHIAALETLAEVVPSPKTVRINGAVRRGLIIPARFLPGWKEPEAPEDETQQ